MTAFQQIAFDSIDRLKGLTTADEVLNEIRRSVDHFGIENFCISGVPLPHEDATPYVMISGWPETWLQRYLERGYIHTDPIIRQVLKSDLPFSWDEAPYDASNPLEARVMNEAPDFGLAEGFAIPIHSARGFQAIVTLGAHKLALNQEQRRALHLIAIYAHDAARELHLRRSGPVKHKEVKLSRREVECLKWTSDGKTSWEISVILGLSEKTVTEYLTSAARKLNSSNRTHAVAQAMRRNIIG